MSIIQDYVKYIIKNNEELFSISPIHICINKINKSLVFKIKYGYKLDLLIPETMVAQRNTTKNRENLPIHKVVEIVLVQCNLIDKQHQQNSEVLHTFIHNKYYSYLVHVEPGNLVLLTTFNIEFHDIIMAFTDYLQKQKKILVLICLVINRNETLFF